MRDSSLRFVKSLDIAQGVISSVPTLELSAGLNEVIASNQAAGILFEQIKAGGAPATADQALALLSDATEFDQIAAATFRAVPQMAELQGIMAEMKLTMPRDILLKAQYAAIVTLFAAHVSEAGASNGNQASSAAVTDFVDAVRSNFGLDSIAQA